MGVGEELEFLGVGKERESLLQSELALLTMLGVSHCMITELVVYMEWGRRGSHFCSLS